VRAGPYRGLVRRGQTVGGDRLNRLVVIFGSAPCRPGDHRHAGHMAAQCRDGFGIQPVGASAGSTLASSATARGIAITPLATRCRSRLLSHDGQEFQRRFRSPARARGQSAMSEATWRRIQVDDRVGQTVLPGGSYWLSASPISGSCEGTGGLPAALCSHSADHRYFHQFAGSVAHCRGWALRRSICREQHGLTRGLPQRS